MLQKCCHVLLDACHAGQVQQKVDRANLSHAEAEVSHRIAGADEQQGCISNSWLYTERRSTAITECSAGCVMLRLVC